MPAFKSLHLALALMILSLSLLPMIVESDDQRVVDEELFRYLKAAGIWSPELRNISVGYTIQTTDLLTDGDVLFYLSKFRPPTLNSTVLASSFVVGILPVCVVYHVSDVPTPQLGLDTTSLGAALRGLASRVLTDEIFPTAYAAGWDFTYHVPVAQSGLGDAFLQSMTASGVANFSAATYPSDVLANPNVTAYASETEIADAVAAAPGRIGILSLSTALRYRLPCMQLRIPRLKNTDLITTPRLLLASQSLYRVSGSVVVPNAANQLTYPLVGAVVLHTNPGLSCGNASAGTAGAGTRIGERTLSFLFGLLNASFDRALQLNGALPVSSTTRNAVVSTAIRVLCTGRNVIAAGGSTAVQLLVSEWIAKGWQQAGMYMSYGGTGSGAGVIGVRGGSLLVGASEAPLNATDVALNPTLQLIPMIATPLSMIVNIGESGSVIRVPRCMVPPLMAGLIPYWDDAAIQAVNPSLVLPRQAVTVLHRADSSGSTEVFLTGLRALDMECANGSLGIRVGTSWPFNNTNRQSASGTASLMTLSSRVKWSVTYASTPTAVSAGATQAVLVDPATDTEAAAEAVYVNDALSSMRLNPTTLETTLAYETNSYPFIGVTYFVIDLNRAGSCVAYKAALRFVLWTLTSNDALLVSLGQRFYPLPSKVVSAAVSRIQALATCDGNILYPVPKPPSDYTAAAIGGAFGGVLLIVIVVGVVILQRGKRDNSAAPKDASKPFAIAFTDIQSSTMLWAQIPDVMSEALDTHHRLLRECLRKHNGYEVKTIGDAFMVAFADPIDAVAFAAATQEALFEYDWGTDAIDEVYRDQLEQRREENPGEVLPERMSKDEYRKWFNGLRVRVGVHFGEGEIQFDEVTKGYDYYGTVVNTAARIEDAANGAQVVVSEAVMNELARKDATQPYGILALGRHPLRGLDVPQNLFQLQLSRFSGRSYPPLRVDSEDDQGESLLELKSRDSRDTSRDLGGPSALLTDQLEIAFSILPAAERTKMVGRLCAAWKISDAADLNKYSLTVNQLARRIASIHHARNSKSNSRSCSNSVRSVSIRSPEHGMGPTSFNLAHVPQQLSMQLSESDIPPP